MALANNQSVLRISSDTIVIAAADASPSDPPGSDHDHAHFLVLGCFLAQYLRLWILVCTLYCVYYEFSVF